MLNKDNIRELAYVVRVTNVLPMDADKLECVQINGWNCVCSKGTFHKGDLGIFFEIDSQLPEVEPFTNMEFLKSKHYKIKSQKIRGVISQGLLLSPMDFGWTIQADGSIWNPDAGDHGRYEEGTFLTKELNVTYAIPEDNHRKSKNGDPLEKYKRMSSRHPQLARKYWWRWLMKKSWGRDLLFVFFGKRRDAKNRFPKHFEYIHVTDEERVENMPWILQDEEPWVKTVKIDGTSSTYILEKKTFGYEYYVCSRNVRQMDRSQKNYHNDFGSEGNVYWDMNDKYHIYDFLKDYLEKTHVKYACLQGETAGQNIQGNPHKFPDVRFFGFNFIDSQFGRWDSVSAADLCSEYGIPWVPIIDTNYILPDDLEEFKLSADGPCEAPDAQGLREGYVYRSKDGKKSFKNVSREYLIAKHE